MARLTILHLRDTFKLRSSKRSLFDKQDCTGYTVQSEADVGGIGVLIGFTISAVLSLVLTFLRWWCGRKLLRRLRLKRESGSNLPTARTDISASLNSLEVYKKWRRILNKMLLFVSDLQITTTISLLIAGHIQFMGLSGYHRELVYSLTGFIQSANFVALIYLFDTLPDRDMIVRECMILTYYALYVWYWVRIAAPSTLANPECYLMKILWVSQTMNDGKTALQLSLAWHIVAIFLVVYITLRRKAKVIRALGFGMEVATRPFESAFHHEEFRSQSPPRALTWTDRTQQTFGWKIGSKTCYWIEMLFFQKGTVLVFAVLNTAWSAYDTWGGLFLPNQAMLKASAGIKVEQGDDMEWGFGQVLTVALAGGQCLLQFWQAWSDELETQNTLEVDPDQRPGSKDRTKTSIRRLYEEYGLISKYDEDSYHESSILLSTILLAIIRRRREERRAGSESDRTFCDPDSPEVEKSEVVVGKHSELG